MNDISIRITHRHGDVERTIDIDSHNSDALTTAAVLPASAPESVSPERPSASALEWSATLCNRERVDYDDAVSACEALGEGWRLPTRTELLSLVDDTRHDPAIDTALYPDTQSGAYWTSTPCAWALSSAWIVYFGYGYSLSCPPRRLPRLRACGAFVAGRSVTRPFCAIALHPFPSRPNYERSC
jgi:hypothetical protein